MLAVSRQPSGLAIRVEWAIIDATIVGAPIQHNSKEENEQIKHRLFSVAEMARSSTDDHPCTLVDGEFWQSKNITAAITTAILCQKDRDARWTKKHSRSYFGYKDHVKIDVSRTCVWIYDEYDERHLCKNDRISSRNILNNNDEPRITYVATVNFGF